MVMGRKFTIDAMGRQVVVYELIGDCANFALRHGKVAAVRVDDLAPLADVIDDWVSKGMRPRLGRECYDRDGNLLPRFERVAERIDKLVADAESRLDGGACPDCRHLLEPGWRFCPYCGEPIRGTNNDEV